MLTSGWRSVRFLVAIDIFAVQFKRKGRGHCWKVVPAEQRDRAPPGTPPRQNCAEMAANHRRRHDRPTSIGPGCDWIGTSASLRPAREIQNLLQMARSAKFRIARGGTDSAEIPAAGRCGYRFLDDRWPALRTPNALRAIASTSARLAIRAWNTFAPAKVD